MKSDRSTHAKVIELGAATRCTKGPWGHVADDVLKQDMQGLARD
jgi:hypothetical protein